MTPKVKFGVTPRPPPPIKLKYGIKGRIRSCEFLRIFAYTDDGLFQVRSDKG